MNSTMTPDSEHFTQTSENHPEKRLGYYLRLTTGTSLLIFLTLALATGHADDPSLFTVSSRAVARNIVGDAGSTVSDFLRMLFGAGAWLPLLFLGQVVWTVAREKSVPLRMYAGWALALIAVPAIFSGILPPSWTSPYPPGGSTGEFFYGQAVRHLNPAGTYLFYLTLLTLAALTVALPTLHSLEQKLKNKWRLRRISADQSHPPAPEDQGPPGEQGRSLALPEEEVKDLSLSSVSVTKNEDWEENGEDLEDGEDLGEDEAPDDTPHPLPPPGGTQNTSRKLSGGAPPATDFRPPEDVMDPLPPLNEGSSPQFLKETERTLADFFRTYGVPGRMAGCQPGPVVTLFEFHPAPGIKVNRVTGLTNELSLALKVPHIHIQVPIPGKSAVGLEVPNPKRQVVVFREIFQSSSFRSIGSPLALALGKNISGDPVAFDLARMPHLLIAGATGTGKSVCMNVLVTSILMNAGPDEVRFLMIDPKRLEFAPYEGIPHLLGPVVTDPRIAAQKLRILNDEMLRRYDLMKTAGVRNIAEFRKAVPKSEWFPYIVVLIDELADLMLSLKKDVEPQIIRLAQMARASGIHLVLATQRPSAQVLTGLIKANIPTKIAFQVTTQIDSRVILDQGGAELLLGAGDMLMRPPGTDALRRMHGAFISEGEVHRIVESWSRVPPPDDRPLERLSGEFLAGGAESSGEEDVDENDTLYPEAVQLVRRQRKASTSLIQRHFRIGYNRAARLIERMESEGIIGQQEGSRPRTVLDRKESNGPS
ncbi:DNA translocase FtsK [Leptospirillum ferriphilum]|uniref:DNA segregation ATPase FtsK/SpoIIIE, S-DNA-T family n=3 Tax=Leptospirillum TaxID=179 RepID=A0A2I2MFS9_9BACT|nr:DNA translocase FtsK [Leptospirillum ferriphilum]